MGLTYPPQWKFEGVGIAVPPDAVAALADLARDIGSGAESPKAVYEAFKARFGAAGSSSSTAWAESDMRTAMSGFADNAAKFVDSYWMGVCDAREMGLTVPSHEQVNKILRKHRVGLTIDPPNLRLTADSALGSSDEPGVPSFPLYTLLEKIGEGGYGQVFRASRKTTFGDFQFAIKVLNPSGFVTDQEKAVLRFGREVRALQALQHRAIVPYLDAGIDAQGRPFLLMPFIEGRPVHKAVPRRDAEAALSAILQVLDGLEYAHAMGVLHRDLKPSNILVRSSDKQAVIVDFGAAFMLEESKGPSLTTSLVGSLGYIPHEVIANPKERTPAHDIYSCGVILYEIISGHRPDPQDYQPLMLLDGAFGDVDDVVLRATAPVRERYPTARSFREDLRRLLDGRGASK